MKPHAEAAANAQRMAEEAIRRRDHAEAARCWITAADNWAAHAAAVPEDRSAARLAQSHCWHRVAEAADFTAIAVLEDEPQPTQPGGDA